MIKRKIFFVDLFFEYGVIRITKEQDAQWWMIFIQIPEISPPK